MKNSGIILSIFLVMSSIQLTQAQDWAFLERFKQDNMKLEAPAPGEDRVVFMGNSITEGWISQRPEFFAGKAYVNRGISGQTTPQMLIRFRQDVINLRPSVVIILAGTNDIAGNTGPASLEEIMGNLSSMAELAAANNIKVILCSVLPAADYPWKRGLEPAEKIIRLNKMMKEYAKANNFIYLDYFSAMADENKGLKKEFSEDGVHPNIEGYKVMEPMAEKAIRKALKKK